MLAAWTNNKADSPPYDVSRHDSKPTMIKDQSTKPVPFSVEPLPWEVCEDQRAFLGWHLVFLGTELVEQLAPHGLEDGAEQGASKDEGRLVTRKGVAERRDVTVTQPPEGTSKTSDMSARTAYKESVSCPVGGQNEKVHLLLKKNLFWVRGFHIKLLGRNCQKIKKNSVSQTKN